MSRRGVELTPEAWRLGEITGVSAVRRAKLRTENRRIGKGGTRSLAALVRVAGVMGDISAV